MQDGDIMRITFRERMDFVDGNLVPSETGASSVWGYRYKGGTPPRILGPHWGMTPGIEVKGELPLVIRVPNEFAKRVDRIAGPNKMAKERFRRLRKEVEDQNHQPSA